MQDTPVTVTAFSREGLETYAIEDLETLRQFTPGLYIQDSASSAGGYVSMRGISSGTGNPSFDQTVAVVFDGVAVNHSYIMRVSQLDVEQIEVLKGPQALFFGKNSPGGVISFRTADPGDEFEAAIRAGYEFDADEARVEGIVSGPITETLGGRLAVSWTDSKGWINNELHGVPGFDADESRFPALDEVFARGTLVWEPNDRFSSRTKISINELERNSGSANQVIYCPSGFGPTLPNVTCGSGRAVFELAPQAMVDHWDFIDRRDHYSTVDWTIFGHEMEFQLNDVWTLTSVTGYQDMDMRFNADVYPGAGNYWNFTAHTENEAFTQELRLTSSFDGPLNYTLGALYGDAEHNNVHRGAIGTVVLLGAPDPLHTVDTDTLSVFGELTWDITDQLTLSAGARYSDEDKTFSVMEGGVAVTNIVTDADSTNTSPEISLTYKPAENTTLYVGYREGYKSGGFNTIYKGGGFARNAPEINDVSYGPETVEGWEAGFKADLLDARLRFNAAIFSYDYQDQQVNSLDIREDGNSTQRVINAADSSIDGAEIEITYLPESIEGLTLNLGVAYTDATYDKIIVPCSTIAVLFADCSELRVPGVLEQDQSGRAMNFAPELTLSAGVTYYAQLSEDWGMRTGLSVYYSDGYNTNIDDYPNTVQGSFTKSNASLTLTYQDNWDFSLIATNLEDEFTYADTGGPARGVPFGPNDELTVAGAFSRGRTVILQARWTY